MYKKMLYVVCVVACVSLILRGMGVADTSEQSVTTSTTNTLDAEKAAVSKELKKTKAELQSIQKNTTLAPALAVIESKIQKVISSAEFQAGLEKMATKEAQEMQEGKPFSSVKYTHSLSQDFPKLENPNKLLARTYGLMANIAHYELLLSKLGSAASQTPSDEQQKGTTEATSSELPTPAEPSPE